MITINGFKIEPTMFPDKTSQVWKLPEEIIHAKHVKVVWNFQTENEILHLAQLTMLLAKYAQERSEAGQKFLHIDYLPYARQDKDISNESTFALHVFASFLNILQYKAIEILDPHSDEALKLILNSYAVYPKDIVEGLANSPSINAHIVCYPDNGAYTKYNQVYNFGDFIGEVYGDKVRNPSTGEIVGLSINYGANKVYGKNILIVDDICDGGRTFIELAKLLQGQGVNEINLFVTHGIFSKGITPLYQAGISRVFTAKGEAVYVDKDTVGIKPYEK